MGNSSSDLNVILESINKSRNLLDIFNHYEETSSIIIFSDFTTDDIPQKDQENVQVRENIQGRENIHCRKEQDTSQIIIPYFQGRSNIRDNVIDINVNQIKLSFHQEKNKFVYKILNISDSLTNRIKQKLIHVNLFNNYSVTLYHGKYAYIITRVGIKIFNIKIRNTFYDSEESSQNVKLRNKTFTPEIERTYKEFLDNIDDPYCVLILKLILSLHICNYHIHYNTESTSISCIIEFMIMHVMGMLFKIGVPKQDLEIFVNQDLKIAVKDKIISLPRTDLSVVSFNFETFYYSLWN